MAATLLRFRLFSSGQILYKTGARNYAKTYYVLLPEIPSDTAENNPLLQLDGPPRFEEINPDKVLTGCTKRAIEYEMAVGQHVEKLKDPNYPKTFENVLEPMERLNPPINFAFNIARAKYLTHAKDEYVKNYMRVTPQIDKAKDERFVNEALFHAIQEVKADEANLTDYQKRLVDFYLLTSRHSGIELSGDSKRRFVYHMLRLNESLTHFSNRLSIAHNLYIQVIDDFNYVVEFPQELLREMTPRMYEHNPNHGPWQVILSKEIYEPFMEYCSHRMLRWNVWQAHRRRACQDFVSDNVSNHMVIEEIREQRKGIAELLGYENHAHMSLETKMAGSVDNVINLIESLKAKFYPKLVDDLSQLQEFAQSKGFNSKIELWDLPYWRRRHKEDLFNMIENQDVMPYFPYNKVLESLFSWCKQLFGVEFKDITSSVQTWPGKNVSCYAVLDAKSGEELGSLYVDPFRRIQKHFGYWTHEIRDKCDLLGTKAISYIHLGLTPSYNPVKPALLTVQQAHEVFAQFGQGLQQVMSEVPYSEISGPVNMELDTRDTCAKVMGKLFYNPTVLRSVTSHYETGEQMPESNISTIIDMSKYLSSYDKMYDLYISALDMEMSLSTDYWRDGMKKLWPEYIPLTLHREDEHPCSLQEIFSGSYHASYYSLTWSEMLAADIASTFEQAGFDNPEQLAIVGKRFRDTYLSLGGGVSGNEIFRRFQGRDPTIEPFLKFYNVSQQI